MTLPSNKMVELALTILGVGAGLLGGGVGGYRLGIRVRGRRGRYWTLNFAVVLGCAVLDFAALASGRYALAYSAVGLMGGLITGMKYGYTDGMRVWHDPGSSVAPPDATGESAADSPVGAKDECVDPEG